jgi:hypothetical protein
MPWTREELSAAFNAVANPTDWRAPICAEVRIEDFAKTAEAVGFFTATELVARHTPGKPGWFLVEAVGYRAGPAGP